VEVLKNDLYYYKNMMTLIQSFFMHAITLLLVGC